MNPILLKPMGGVSQVSSRAAPIGVMSAREYYAAKDRLWPRVAAAYDRLAAAVRPRSSSRGRAARSRSTSPSTT